LKIVTAPSKQKTPTGGPTRALHFHPGMKRDQHPTAYQPEHGWPHRHQTPYRRPTNQHANMNLAAIFHVMASYNPESRREQETMLGGCCYFLPQCCQIHQLHLWNAGDAMVSRTCMNTVSTFLKVTPTRLQKM
jgi:hypothetical protein